MYSLSSTLDTTWWKGIQMMTDNTQVIEDIQKMRKKFKDNDDKRDQGLPTSVPGVQRIDDLQYGQDPQWNKLDLYLPTNVNGKLPTIINIHGGGWAYATKETYQFYGMGPAKRGFAFVNPSYRLAPDVQFPEQLNEVNEYIHWVAANADKYNLDKENVFLIGDSAGGEMAEQYAAVLTNPAYRELCGYQLTDLHFRAVVLNCPATFMLDPSLIKGATKAYFPANVLANTRYRKMIEVEKYITKDYLPTFIATANEDFVRDCSIRLDGFLRGKGVEVVQRSWGDKKHPEKHVFMISQKDPLATAANDAEMAFFRQHLVK